MKYQETIALTSLRLDKALISKAFTQVVLLELSKPWENNCCEELNEKRSKHQWVGEIAETMVCKQGVILMMWEAEDFQVSLSKVITAY